MTTPSSCAAAKRRRGCHSAKAARGVCTGLEMLCEYLALEGGVKVLLDVFLARPPAAPLHPRSGNERHDAAGDPPGPERNPSRGCGEDRLLEVPVALLGESGGGGTASSSTFGASGGEQFPPLPPPRSCDISGKSHLKGQAVDALIFAVNDVECNVEKLKLLHLGHDIVWVRAEGRSRGLVLQAQAPSGTV